MKLSIFHQVRLGEHDLASNEDSAHPEEYKVLKLQNLTRKTNCSLY